MSFTPLALGTTANPLDVLTAQEKAALLECGPLDLGRLNAILKLIADRIDAIDAADNAIVGASYNATTNVLTFTMSDGLPVNIDMTALVADSVATGAITGSSYNAATNVLTLTFANGTNVPVDLTGVVNDAISGAIMPVGGIIMWSGGVVPGGWALCDGNNGTPDLRDKFIVGAGGAYASGAMGGAVNHNHAVTVDANSSNTSLSTTTQPVDAGGSAGAMIKTAFLNDPTHTHTASSGNASSLPPYYALAYIMKI